MYIAFIVLAGRNLVNTLDPQFTLLISIYMNVIFILTIASWQHCTPPNALHTGPGSSTVQSVASVTGVSGHCPTH